MRNTDLTTTPRRALARSHDLPLSSTMCHPPPGPLLVLFPPASSSSSSASASCSSSSTSSLMTSCLHSTTAGDSGVLLSGMSAGGASCSAASDSCAISNICSITNGVSTTATSGLSATGSNNSSGSSGRSSSNNNSAGSSGSSSYFDADCSFSAASEASACLLFRQLHEQRQQKHQQQQQQQQHHHQQEQHRQQQQQQQQQSANDCGDAQAGHLNNFSTENANGAVKVKQQQQQQQSTQYQRQTTTTTTTATILSNKALQQTPSSSKFSFLRRNIGNRGSSTPKRTISLCPFTTPDRLNESFISHEVFESSSSTNHLITLEEKNSFSPCIDWQSTMNPTMFDTSNPAAYLPPTRSGSAEQKIQNAITAFFREKKIVPSPNSIDGDRKMRCHVALETSRLHEFDVTLSSKRLPQASSAWSDRCNSARNAACQTTVTIPPSVDLNELFAPFATYVETEHRISFMEASRISTSSSSSSDSICSISRRKLFSEDDDRPISDDGSLPGSGQRLEQDKENLPPASTMLTKNHSFTDTLALSSPPRTTRANSSVLAESYEFSRRNVESSRVMMFDDIDVIGDLGGHAESDGDELPRGEFNIELSPIRPVSLSMTPQQQQQQQQQQGQQCGLQHQQQRRDSQFPQLQHSAEVPVVGTKQITELPAGIRTATTTTANRGTDTSLCAKVEAVTSDVEAMVTAPKHTSSVHCVSLLRNDYRSENVTMNQSDMHERMMDTGEVTSMEMSIL